MLKSEYKSPKDKPYFLMGFEKAKMILVQLRKEKYEQLNLSPINQRHLKLSTDQIISEEGQYDQNNIEKGYNERLDKKQRKLDSKKKKEVERSQTQTLKQTINQLGKKLEEVYDQIQLYQTVFHNLCQCYSANSSIISRNARLKKQSLRLIEARQQITDKINKLHEQLKTEDQMEKQADKFIQKKVHKYVEDCLIYNNWEEGLRVPQHCQFQHYQFQECDRKKDQEQEQEQKTQIKLNYSKLKKQKAGKMAKKSNAPKLYKGPSFEQQISEMSRYYQSQFHDI